MKKTLFIAALFCGFALLVASCLKEQEKPTVTIDIKVPAPVISSLGNTSKKLDFTVEVTQTGSFFYQDFDFKLTKLGSSVVLDSFHTLLPTAMESVRHSVIVDQPGDYWVNVVVGSGDNSVGSGNIVIVPQ